MNMATLGSITLDSVPSTGAKTKQYTTDGRLVFVRTKTYTTDAVLQKNQTKTYTTDAVLQGGSTKFYSTDGLLVTPYHDYGSYSQLIGNNLTATIDPNRISTWTTYNRPSVPFDGMSGINTITGKHEHYNAKAAQWQLYDGTSAP